ncbi:MAG: hypothetical protein HKO66_04530 [Saprospiraceae bacterium]|nr:hypothetical protein [Bacteroidia bacterium]NNE14524.1 hypothetical protein [Saprospiraceae bacterium]NNL91476.1 hypothetical protein [Saprospiraceae bacterium]
MRIRLQIISMPQNISITPTIFRNTCSMNLNESIAVIKEESDIMLFHRLINVDSSFE